MRVLYAVVEPAPTCLQIAASEFAQRCAVRWEAIGDQDIWLAISSHEFSQHFQCRAFVSSHRDDAFQNLTLVIHGAPEIVTLAIDLHEDLIQVPLPFRERAQLLNPISSDL